MILVIIPEFMLSSVFLSAFCLSDLFLALGGKTVVGVLVMILSSPTVSSPGASCTPPGKLIIFQYGTHYEYTENNHHNRDSANENFYDVDEDKGRFFFRRLFGL